MKTPPTTRLKLTGTGLSSNLLRACVPMDRQILSQHVGSLLLTPGYFAALHCTVLYISATSQCNPDCNAFDPCGPVLRGWTGWRMVDLHGFVCAQVWLRFPCVDVRPRLRVSPYLYLPRFLSRGRAARYDFRRIYQYMAVAVCCAPSPLCTSVPALARAVYHLFCVAYHGDLLSMKGACSHVL